MAIIKTTSTRKIFDVRVHGEYITRVTTTECKLKSFSATFKVFNAVTALSVIRGKLLIPFLAKTDPGVVADYEVIIDEIKTQGGEVSFQDLPIAFMNKEQLTDFCAFHKLPVPVAQYRDTEICRRHVELADNSIEDFQKAYDAYVVAQSDMEDLFALNADSEVMAGGEVKVHPETGVVKDKEDKKISFGGESVPGLDD